MKTTTLKKKMSHAFGKDIYLLGIDMGGERYWLEDPSWNCGWYWGFGYIETYTNVNSPGTSSGISSHSHWNSRGNNPLDKYDQITFEKDRDKVCKLFDQFYSLRKESDEIHVSGKHSDQSERYHEINEVLIPAITEEIISILTP